MPKYVTRAYYVSVDRWGQESHTADEVNVDDDCPRDTGLIDAMGNRIYRESDRMPVGFDVGRRSTNG